MDAIDERTAPRVLGLTGPIACGKTTVGDLLLELGALERIDADESVHELMLPGTRTTHAVASAFGPEIIEEDGSVDRARLAEVVFGNPEQLRRLEEIVHPAVRQLIRRRLSRRPPIHRAASNTNDQTDVIVLDAVKLLQSDLLDLCSAVWVVHCSHSTELQRLMRNRSLSREQAEARLASQPFFENPKVTEAIENSGSLQDLKARVQTAWSLFLASSV
jgi:dephospho-CoA kinase